MPERNLLIGCSKILDAPEGLSRSHDSASLVSRVLLARCLPIFGKFGKRSATAFQGAYLQLRAKQLRVDHCETLLRRLPASHRHAHSAIPRRRVIKPTNPNWATELASWNDELNLPRVIEHGLHTRQIISLVPLAVQMSPGRLAKLCEKLCGHFCRELDGLIHVFQAGFFNSAGESIFPANPRHRLQTR